MGRFRRLRALLTGREEALYQCLSCHSQFERRHQVCPECDGYDIRRTEWLDEQTVEEYS